MVDRLLDPGQREGLPAAELARLTDVVALGLHNTYRAGGRAVGGGAGVRVAVAGAAQPGGADAAMNPGLRSAAANH